MIRIGMAVPAALLAGAIWTNVAIAGQATADEGSLPAQDESMAAHQIAARQMVTPPPGFTESCRRYAWVCENGRIGRLSQDELLAQANRINREVNRRIREMTDVANYGSVDYWTLPSNGRGDCEDFVLEKYQRLLAAGADGRDLAIAVVLDRHGENHAVLVLRHETGDLVLDNLASDIRPWNETGYRFLAMQTSDDKRLWEVVMHQPLDSSVLAQR